MQSREEAIFIIREEYSKQGVFLGIMNSKKSRVILKCDRGGYKRHRDTVKKQSPTRLIGCEFKICLYLENGIWKDQVLSGLHNHDMNTENNGKKCGYCGKFGHNIRSCFNDLSEYFNEYSNETAVISDNILKRNNLKLPPPLVNFHYYKNGFNHGTDLKYFAFEKKKFEKKI